MIDVSRRLFLGGVATAMAVKPSVGRAAVPILYGNMIHDDAPALNAWLRGDPIRVLDDDLRIHGEGYRIIGADLLIGSTVCADEIPLELDRVRITAKPELEGPMIRMKGAHTVGALSLVAGENTEYSMHIDDAKAHIHYLSVDMSKSMKRSSAGLRIGSAVSHLRPGIYAI